MNYLARLSEDEVRYICSVIPPNEAIYYFKRNPKDFAKIMPGFRAASMNHEQISTLLFRYRKRHFISSFVEKIISKWLKEIKEHIAQKIEKGANKESALLATLPFCFFSDNILLYFKLINEECSEEFTSLLSSAIKAIKEIDAERLSDGFATLFLNRVNFSGIIKGGPIGGLTQSGTYRIDCRFNKADIIKRIEQISLLKDRIELFNCDANELLSQRLQGRINTSFFNIDPPYVKKGHRLYTSYFKEEDHRKLEKTIKKHLSETNWIVTYDDCKLIREIYKNYHKVEYSIQHSAGGSVIGKEIVITNIPIDKFIW